MEGKNDNELLMKLLSIWKDLKKIRTTQGYTSTGVKLQIVKSAEIVSAEDWQNEITRYRRAIGLISSKLQILNGIGICRQANELMEEARHSATCLDSDSTNKSDSYQFVDNANVPSVEEIRAKVVQEVTDSLPAPGEPFFIVTLIEQEITSDGELTNPM